MPVMSGRELAQRFAVLHPETKVVYMSGYDRDSAADAPPEEAFLAKPFTPDELVAKVQAALAAPAR
jgi:CheY-like chemotaxis protein